MSEDDETLNLEGATYCAVAKHFEDLRDAEPRDVCAMTMTAVRRGMLQATMRAARGNQSKAARWLGLNRATLRSWLRECGLVEPGDVPDA